MATPLTNAGYTGLLAQPTTDSERAIFFDDEELEEEQVVAQASGIGRGRRATFLGLTVVMGTMVTLAVLYALKPRGSSTMESGPTIGRPSKKKLKGKHSEFISYSAADVQVETADKLQICDPIIVAETCKTMNLDTPEFYGTAADTDTAIVHASELAEILLTAKDSVWSFLTAIGATNVAQNGDAFAVNCQELCEKTVANYPPWTVPHYSDIGCYWPPGIHGIFPTCDVDVSAKAMSDIRFKDKTNETEAALNWDAGHAGKDPVMTELQRAAFDKNKMRNVLYREHSIETVRMAIANKFHIFPVIRTHIDAPSGAEPPPGLNSGQSALRAALRAGVNSDSCTWAKDNVCDETTYCTAGTDCSDCGTCPGGQLPATTAAPPSCPYENDGECDVPRWCPAGTDSQDCGGSAIPGPTDSCRYAHDNWCDEPYSCSPNTDCSDCGNCEGATTPAPTPTPSPTPAPWPISTAPPTQANSDSCRWAKDGMCDETAYCPAGTDCTDCGNCGASGGGFVTETMTFTTTTAPTVNDDSCRWAKDGYCDLPSTCAAGTDCTDCRTCSNPPIQTLAPTTTSTTTAAPTTILLTSPAPIFPGTNSDTCRYAKDGECDEPRYCSAGTDCTDCNNCAGGLPVVATTAAPTAAPPSGGWKSDVLRVAVTAKAFTNSALNHLIGRRVNAQMLRWYGKNDEATRTELKRILNGIVNMIGNVDYIYPGDQCGANTYAYVYPSPPWNKNSNGEFKFYLCNYYMQVNRGEKIETLTHEGAHHMDMLLDDVKYNTGTAYGRSTCKSMANDCRIRGGSYCTSALKNSDTLCYFINDVAMEVGGLSATSRKWAREAPMAP